MCGVQKTSFAENPKREPGKRQKQRRLLNKRPGIKHPLERERKWRDSREGRRGVGLKDQPLVCRENGGGRSGEEGPIETQVSWEEKAREYSAYFASLYDWDIPASSQEAGVPGFREIGRLPRFYHPKQKVNSRWGTELAKEHPELGAKTRGFGWPEFGPKAELKSLTLQASRWLLRAEHCVTPTAEERERVVRKTVEMYAHAASNGPTATREGTLVWQDFLKDFKQAVESLEMDAGIGVPYIAYGRPTHRGWVEDPKLLPVLARLTFNRLQKMLEVRFDALRPEQLIREGLCDPVRLFVKGEPHKQAKLDEGRYRLIMSISLVDQLVARVLFQNQNKREITLWSTLPSKPGFGLSTDEQVLGFTESLAHQIGVSTTELISNWARYLVPTDCSGFDWSVSQWMLHDEMLVRNLLTTDLNSVTEQLRACWLYCLSNSVLCLSDGRLLAQTVPGVQKSGSYNTSSSNSRIRVMAALHCGATWAIAMGDDALESTDSRLEEYNNLGFKVEVSEQLEFCSHKFERPDLAIPLNSNKMLYKLIFGYEPGSGNLEVVKNYLDACFSVLNELRHDPDSVALLYQWLVTPVLPQKI